MAAVLTNKTSLTLGATITDTSLTLAQKTAPRAFENLVPIDLENRWAC